MSKDASFSIDLKRKMLPNRVIFSTLNEGAATNKQNLTWGSLLYDFRETG